MSGAPVLQTVGLEKRFGGVHAIAGVDFVLAEGELRCLIGPMARARVRSSRC
jgi:branched-chain amino acid transport system ATP-binding protein/urea transport system ATP-binding protein